MTKPLDPLLIKLRRELDEARAVVAAGARSRGEKDEIEQQIERELQEAEAKQRLTWAEQRYRDRFNAVLFGRLRVE